MKADRDKESLPAFFMKNAIKFADLQQKYREITRKSTHNAKIIV